MLLTGHVTIVHWELQDKFKFSSCTLINITVHPTPARVYGQFCSSRIAERTLVQTPLAASAHITASQPTDI